VREADVRTWARSNRVSCRAASDKAGLECTDVPLELLRRAGKERTTLHFRFDADGRLVAVLAMMKLPAVERAVELVAAAQASLKQALGKPSRSRGEASREYFSRGALAQARAEYRFRDYSAVWSATNMGAQGYYMVTDEAQILD
jgi:hypothetical protein